MVLHNLIWKLLEAITVWQPTRFRRVSTLAAKQTSLSIIPWFILFFALGINADNYNLWSYQTKLYLNTGVDGANVSGDVVDFPILVRLTSSNFNFAQAKTNGEDIRFAKHDGTHLFYEIEDWSNSSQTAAIWVLVDSIYGNNSLQYIKMYWGKADAGDSSNSEQVFSTTNNFVGVWHLNDDFLDATLHSNDATNYQSVDGACVIADGQDFDGNNDYISVATSSSLDNLNLLTGSAWVKTEDGSQNYQTIISFYSSITDRTYIANYNTNYGLASYNDINNDGNWNGTTGSMLTQDQWYHVAWVIDGANWVVYRNGEYIAGTNNSRKLIDLNDGFLTNFGRRAGQNNNYFDGDLDEVRIANIDRSAHWIKLCYENQQTNQTLVEMGIEKYEEWSYKKKIYINTTAAGADVSGNVSEFPLLIRLHNSNFNFYEAQSNGEDIRFSQSNGTHLVYVIERWDNVKDSAEIWVKIPTVYGNNNTQYIYMYWGCSEVPDSSNSTSVFATTNDFAGVWHLHDDFNDATANANNGTNNGSSDIVGYIGDAQSFNGSSNYITISDVINDLDVNTGTISAWVKMANTIIDDNAHHTILGIGRNNNNDGFWFRKWNNNNLRFRYRVNDQSTTSVIGDISGYGDTWVYLVAAWDGTYTYIYENGVQVDVDDRSAKGNITLSNLDRARIGVDAIGNPNLYFNGVIDEVRIASVKRSADWIKLAYETQKNDQASSGEEDYDDWLYSQKTYINTTPSGADVSGDVLEFPLLIRLNATNFNFSQAKSDGSDVRFAKADGTHIPYEIERWDDTNDSAEIWVKIDTVYGNNSTQYVDMHWGKSDAVDRSDGTEVFNSSNYFVGVYHLDEEQSGTGTADVYQDASNNDYDGDDYIGNTGQQGIIGRGHDFDGNNDYIDFGDLPDRSSGTITLWFNPDATYTSSSTTSQGIYGKYESTADDISFALRGTDMGATGGEGSPGNLHTKVEYDGTIMHLACTTDTWTGGTWYQAVLTWNGNTGRVYINGIMEKERDVTLSMGNTGADRLGGYRFDSGNISGGPFLYFNGKIDEFRMSNNARSADWIKLSYETQKLNAAAMQQPIIWDGEGSDKNFSTAANWVGDITPSTINDIIFNHTSTKSCSLDISMTVDDITFTTGYTGTFYFTEDTLHATGDVDFSTGGTIVPGNGALEFTGTSSQTFIPKSGQIFPQFIQNGSGGTLITGQALTTYQLNLGSGILDLGDEELYHAADSLTSGAATLDFGTSTLEITTGNAHFANLTTLTAGSGTLKFTHASNTQILTPKASTTHPAIIHSGGGTLQLAGNTVIATSFSQTGGILNLNGQNLQTNGSFTITNGTSSSLSGLTGRTLTIGGNTNLSGQSDNLLDLNTSPSWHYWNVTGILSANFADINYSNASGSAANGEASVTCVDGGTNNSWTFDQEDYGADWTYAKNLYINTSPSGADISGNVSDFPLLVRLNSGNFTFTEAQTNGEDIRFAKADGTPYSYEIEDWNAASQTAEIWVLVDIIYGNTKSQYIKMHWGNVSATSKSSSDKVYQTSNNFTAVLHIHDDFLDATTNNNDGTNNGTADATGVIADGQYFDGGSDDIDLPTASSSINGLQNMTASMWAETDNFNTFDQVLLSFYYSTQDRVYLAYVDATDGLAVYSDIDNVGGTGPDYSTEFIPTNNSWFHAVWVINNSTWSIYINGELEVSYTHTKTMADLDNNFQTRIGRRAGENNGEWQGTIDEISISNNVRSADWIKLSYENQKIGSEVANFSESPVVTGLNASGLVSAAQQDVDTVLIQYEVEDPNDATVTISLDYKLEGSSWTNATSTSGDIGSGIDANSSSTDRTIKWDVRTNLGSTIEDNYYIRVIAEDVSANKDTTESSLFAIDTKSPQGLANFESDDTTNTSITLVWNAATDPNFNHYEIWYGTVQNDVLNRQGTASEWDVSDDATLANQSANNTTITGLSVNQAYFLKIWAIDNMGNETSLADINVTTKNMAAPVWSKSSAGKIKGGAINDASGVLYIGSGPSTDKLTSYNLVNGTIKWSYSTLIFYGECNRPTYTFDDNKYKVLASAGNYVIGRQDNGNSSSELFTPIDLGSPAGNPYPSPDEAAFYVVYNGNLTKRNLNTGAEIWTVSITNANKDADLVTWNDVVYVATTDGIVHKRNAANGSANQTFDAQDNVNLPLLVQDDVLYITPQNDTVYSIDALNLTSVNWKHHLGTDNTGAVFNSLNSSQLYVAATDSVKQINTSTGARNWSYYTGSTVSSGPIPSEGHIYFGCDNGFYYTLTDAGTIVSNWPYTETNGAANTGPWIDVGNGCVIFGTTGGNLDSFTLISGTRDKMKELLFKKTFKNDSVIKMKWQPYPKLK